MIRRVTPMRRVNAFGERLALDMVPRPALELPADAVVHPAGRTAHHDVAGPERVRQLSAGANGVLRTSWRDPDDMRQAVRTPREISGYRAYCVLRALARRGAAITVEHIAAADYLRKDREIAALGFSPPRDDLLPVGAYAYGPRLGLSDAAIAQAAAARAYARAVARFDAPAQTMIAIVVIANTPLAVWCRGSPGRQVRGETGRLIGILDVLAEHYAGELAAAERRGEMVAAG